MIAATEQKSNTTQNDVTEKLGERVQNINYWKFELERGIQGKLTGDFLIKVTPPTKYILLFSIIVPKYYVGIIHFRHHCRKRSNDY